MQTAPASPTSENADPAPVVELYELITGDEEARVCKDIPEEACEVLPGNFFINLISYSCTKIADALADAKLILAWLLGVVGAPTFFAGLLVPLRESGALLPQLAIAGFLRRAARRKWFWVGGSFFEGVSVLGMALVAATLSGKKAGWAIVALLALFSLSRGVRSVASKDVLGKTVSKERRGTLMGYAGLISGIATLAVGVYARFFHEASASRAFFVLILAAAAGLWLLAALVFVTLREPSGATSGGGNALKEAVRSLSLLRTDRGFRHFVATRALLLSTALAMPFYVVLAREETGSDTAGLGILIIAAGLASAVSAPVWGRFADKSSRLVLVATGVMAAGLGFSLALLSLFEASLLRYEYTFASFFLMIGLTHSGVRLGRKTYLVDMATQETRSAYVAVSNTVIGVLMLIASGFGLLSLFAATEVVIAVLAVFSLFAAFMAFKLPEA